MSVPPGKLEGSKHEAVPGAPNIWARIRHRRGRVRAIKGPSKFPDLVAGIIDVHEV